MVQEEFVWKYFHGAVAVNIICINFIGVFQNALTPKATEQEKISDGVCSAIVFLMRALCNKLKETQPTVSRKWEVSEWVCYQRRAFLYLHFKGGGAAPVHTNNSLTRPAGGIVTNVTVFTRSVRRARMPQRITDDSINLNIYDEKHDIFIGVRRW